MQHDLIAAPVSLAGDRGRELVEGEDGERERVVQSENLFDGRRVAPHIIKNNCQLRGGGRGSTGRVRRVILGRRLGPPGGLTIGFDSLAAGEAEKQRRKRAAKGEERLAPYGKKIALHVRTKRPS